MEPPAQITRNIHRIRDIRGMPVCHVGNGGKWATGEDAGSRGSSGARAFAVCEVSIIIKIIVGAAISPFAGAESASENS